MSEILTPEEVERSWLKEDLIQVKKSHEALRSERDAERQRAEASEKKLTELKRRIYIAEEGAEACGVMPKWVPTEEHPQIDFYEAVVDSLRYPAEDDPRQGSEIIAELLGKLAAAEAQRDQALDTRADGWLPIESAPKDGTPVLLWAPQWKFANCGWWQSSINASNDAGWTDGGVISWNYQENSILLPTHWRPLPDPPQTDKGETPCAD